MDELNERTRSDIAKSALWHLEKSAEHYEAAGRMLSAIGIDLINNFHHLFLEEETNSFHIYSGIKTLSELLGEDLFTPHEGTQGAEILIEYAAFKFGKTLLFELRDKDGMLR